MAQEKLEIRLGDITLEDLMPLHFYGVKDGSKVDALKPYVNVIIENNKGAVIYWRLNRKDAIGEVKVKLPRMSKGTEENLNDDARVEQYRLYLVSDGQNYNELDDNKTVENCKIKEDDKLFLQSYMWRQNLNITVKKTGRQVWGLQPDDSFLGIKVKVQDQTGMPVSAVKLARLAENKWEEWVRRSGHYYKYEYIFNYKELKEIPFNNNQPLLIVTEEELEADAARVKQEEKTWREEVREAHEKGDGEEMRKLGYTGRDRDPREM